MEHKNWEGKTITCLNCKKPVACLCIELDTDNGCYYFCTLKCYEELNSQQELDWDQEVGEYEGHYFSCELGGNFEKKWHELKKDWDNYRELYSEFHARWKKLKYPEGDD